MQNHSGQRRNRIMAWLVMIGLVVLVGGTTGVTQAQTSHIAAAQEKKPCLLLEKEISGPYRTSDHLLLEDRAIPLGVKVLLNGLKENIFSFDLVVTLTNCGSSDLTEVAYTDGFDQEVQPFGYSDPTNVATVWEVFNPINLLNREYITWTVGTIPAGESRKLTIKVGTEFNTILSLAPTQAKSVLVVTNGNRFDGRRIVKGGAAVTSAEGIVVKAPTMKLKLGPQIACAGTNGAWNTLRDRKGLRIIAHNSCAKVTTALPMTVSAR